VSAHQRRGFVAASPPRSRASNKSSRSSSMPYPLGRLCIRAPRTRIPANAGAWSRFSERRHKTNGRSSGIGVHRRPSGRRKPISVTEARLIAVHEQASRRLPKRSRAPPGTAAEQAPLRPGFVATGRSRAEGFRSQTLSGDWTLTTHQRPLETSAFRCVMPRGAFYPGQHSRLVADPADSDDGASGSRGKTPI
jgi:hypothetical protein